MVPHFVFSFLAVLCTVGIVSAGKRSCTAQSDCGANECCAKFIFHPWANCVPRRKLNEICIAGDMGTSLYNGLYDITCPCEEPLICLQDDIVTASGQIVTRGNPRCRQPNYGGSGSAYGYGYANAGSSGSSSSANSGSYGYGYSGSSSPANSVYGNSGNSYGYPYYYGGGSSYASSNGYASA